MKKYLLILLIFISNFSLAQKPIIGQTEQFIKNYNSLEFGTTDYISYTKENLYILQTEIEYLELKTSYFFRIGEKKNIMCGHATTKKITAEAIFEEIMSNSTYIGGKTFRNTTKGVDVDIDFDGDVYTFLFYRF